ncbi:hypothetical protein AX16_005408 [Volvariella volvacea WC 439]|nr:hypothetical protein AX16_005408 [Volvariella volvacea WC 439]
MATNVHNKRFIAGIAEFSENTFRTARRVILNADVIKAAKLCTGDVVIISKWSNAENKAFAAGIVWPFADLPQESVLVSQSLLWTASLESGQEARIIPLTLASSSKVPAGIQPFKQPQDAGIIRLRELSSEGTKRFNPAAKSSEGKQKDWLNLLLRESLVDLKYLTLSQVLEVQYEGQKRRFAVASVDARQSSGDQSADLADAMKGLSVTSASEIWIAGWDSAVVILEKEPELPVLALHKAEIEHLAHKPVNEAYASVGGLHKQIAEIRDLLEIPLTRPDLFRHFGLKPPRGILLHGPPGTGKTHLARAIASSTNSSVLVINGPELSSAYHGETESKLRDVFREARTKSPCIVVLDEVDALVPRREDGGGGEVEKRVVATLLTLLDGMEDGSSGDDTRVVVIGTTNRPNAIDPALRRPGRFDREIEIGVPDAEARFSILKVLLSKVPHSISEEELKNFASRTHGYVGADLSALVREAGTIAIKRCLGVVPPISSSSPQRTSDITPLSTNVPDLTLTISDLIASMPSVRPSAMRSLFVESPPVRYADIGGQADVIQKLKEAVEWPLLHPEAFQRLGVKPPKGVLLCGPPGCSKTVLARACACESGVNFVAVKGPELLNKYVGESERGVREIFRKARAAAPSIIFFDEIDALATSRTSSDTDVGSSHEGVLTSLLNEMDGVQELVGVTVIAATNRPDALDSALMRPGRLDRIVYVGPPDQAGREEILKIRTRAMTVGEDLDIGEIARLTEGCSGAEITAMCQEAAILTMQKDINAPFVPHEAFVNASHAIKRQITPAVLQKFQSWRDATSAKSI